MLEVQSDEDLLDPMEIIQHSPDEQPKSTREETPKRSCRKRKRLNQRSEFPKKMRREASRIDTNQEDHSLDKEVEAMLEEDEEANVIAQEKVPVQNTERTSDEKQEQTPIKDQESEEGSPGDQSDSDSSHEDDADYHELQKIIDQFPAKEYQKLPEIDATKYQNRVTRADLRQNHIVQKRKRRTSQNGATTSETQGDTQKESLFHQSQHIGWKAGTQAATQYQHAMTYNIGISSEDDRERLIGKVNDLDAEYVEDPSRFTHLIVGRLTKTAKIMCAIVSRTEILHSSWINESYKANDWLPTDEYHWTNAKFDAKVAAAGSSYPPVQKAISLHHQLRRRVFDKLHFMLFVKKNKRDSFQQILECGGGKAVSDTPDCVFVDDNFIQNSPANKRQLFKQYVNAAKNCKVYNVNQISKKVLNPEEEFEECRVPWLKNTVVLSTGEESDLSSDASEIEAPARRTKRRVKRKRRPL